MSEPSALGDVTTLIQMLDRFRSQRIMVVGDFMVDRYLYGNAERLSPDAPVPVLALEREESKPGGSANVALDLLALKCQVNCLGIVGDDAAGSDLKSKLKKIGCDVSGLLVADDDRPTTIKLNFVGLAQHRHPQKMFRADRESRLPISQAMEKKLLAMAEKQIRQCQAICLEDYRKGVLTQELCQGIIRLAKTHGIEVLVDPAPVSDYRKYRGATTITPNHTEASLATSMNASSGDAPTLHAMAKKLLNDLALDSVVLTLDKQGALLLEHGGKPRHVPTVARQVYDVTGAGDMVLAMLAAARANGADWPSAVRLANVAAGLEVERFGVVPIALEEVLLSLLEQSHEQLGKVRSLSMLTTELKAHRRQGRRIVFTNGCFDILHAGHVAYLRQARRLGDLLVVGLNSDDSIRNLKGPDRPVNHLNDRLAVLSELQSVDYITVFSEKTPIRLIRAVTPDVLVKGADYRKDQVVGGDWVEKHGGQVTLVDLVPGRSTTNLIRKLSPSLSPDVPSSLPSSPKPKRSDRR